MIYQYFKRQISSDLDEMTDYLVITGKDYEHIRKQLAKYNTQTLKYLKDVHGKIDHVSSMPIEIFTVDQT